MTVVNCSGFPDNRILHGACSTKLGLCDEAEGSSDQLREALYAV